MTETYINTTGLDHDEVALLTARSGVVKPVKGGLHHIEQGGLILGHLAINLVTQIAYTLSVHDS
jgi:hypothetical protein